MYAVTVTRSLVAQHYLTVPDPGPEGELHSHRFELEVTFEGPELNEHGYLVDIDDVKEALDAVEARYADTTLNDAPGFDDGAHASESDVPASDGEAFASDGDVPTSDGDTPASGGTNPSVERFARVVADRIREDTVAASSVLERLHVRIWEDDEAAASYETAL